jgi:hypothetical protein
MMTRERIKINGWLIDEVKLRASGQWPQLLAVVAGLPASVLDGKHHPCPQCGGRDRFRLIDADAGAVFCNQCFNEKNGDGIAATQWALGISFKDAVLKLAEHLAIPTAEERRRDQLTFADVDAAGRWLARKLKTASINCWEYHDAAGRIVGYVLRVNLPNGQKEIRPLRPAKTPGRWEFGAMNEPRPLYALPALSASKRVFIVEGEKCADAVGALGLVCTTSAGGARSPKKSDWTPLAGKEVILVPDNDDAGRAYVQAIAEVLGSLTPPPTIKTLTLDGLAEGEDVADWIGQRMNVGKDELRQQLEALADAAPTVEHACATNNAPPAPLSFVTNVDLNDDGKWTVPRPMRDILADIEKLASGWPRRVGSSLFVPSPDGVCWLESTEALFGWVGSITPRPPRFAQGPGLHSKSEVFHELRRTATNHVAVETLIHEPPLPGHYYACDAPEASDGDHLRWLLNRFSPETDIDRDLIQAALMTPMWGGPGGTRPAFVFTADAGRGCGKSKAVAMISEVVGGHVELSANEDACVIRQRLLSPEGLSKRIAVLDNVKSTRFSWAELEAMITAGIISGKRMYVGEAQRPNTLTWFITLNGVSLSTDMAQRAVIIKLKKPAFDPIWEEQTRAYIREHRREIIADLVAALRAERTALSRYSRWNAWERDVLARLPDPAEAQKVIAERQRVADVESEESAIIADGFRSKLKELRYDPDGERIFIPSAIAAKWLNAILNDRMTTTAASRKLGQLIDEGTIRFIVRAPNNVHGRGFHWVGSQCSADCSCRSDLETRLAASLPG